MNGPAAPGPPAASVESASERASKKVYLAVPFAHKKDAMALGAQFDRASNKWYVLHEQALALQEFPIFKQWLPEDAKTLLAKKTEAPPAADDDAERSEPYQKRQKTATGRAIQGQFKAVWDKIGAAATAVEEASSETAEQAVRDLRALFLREVKWVSPSQAGDLWVEFADALCADCDDEIAGVAELDALLEPDGKKLYDYVDSALLPPECYPERPHPGRLPPAEPPAPAPAQEQPRQPEAPVASLDTDASASGGAAVASSTATSLPPPKPPAPDWQAESAKQAGISEADLARLLEMDRQQQEQNELHQQAGAFAQEQRHQQQPPPPSHGAANGHPPGGTSPLPEGWVESSDPRYGNTPFWYNAMTRETSWTRPTNGFGMHSGNPVQFSPGDRWGRW